MGSLIALKHPLKVCDGKARIDIFCIIDDSATPIPEIIDYLQECIDVLRTKQRQEKRPRP